MKTSNKILLGGFIAVIIFIFTMFIVVTRNISETVETMKENMIVKTIKPGVFDELHASGELKIEWTPGSEHRLEIETNKSAYKNFKHSVKGSKLILKTGGDNPTEILIRMTVDSLSQITLEKEARLEVMKKITQKKLNLTMSTNSVAALAGNIDSATIHCYSNSMLHASQLVLNTCTIETDTEAFAKIHTKQKLKLTANGGSEVEYYGNPETTVIDTQEGSTAKKR